MAVSDITYYPAAGGSFNSEVQDGGYAHSFPLGAREPNHIVVTAEFTQNTANYVRPAPNTLLTYAYNGSNVNCYFVDDTPLEAFRGHPGPVSSWRRTWASVPSSWTDGEEYPYTYPSFTAAGSTTNVGNVTAISFQSGSAGGLNTYYFSIATAGRVAYAGNTVQVSIQYARNSLNYAFGGFINTVYEGYNGTYNLSFLDRFPGTGNFTNVSGTVRLATLARLFTSSQVAPSLLLHDYALTDTVNIDTALPILQPWQPTTLQGNITTALTSTSIPSSAEYFAMKSAGTALTVECTRRRYLGNIWERTTRTIPAA